MDYMRNVEKKSNRNNKRMKVFMLDRFVQKTGPVRRLAILDVVDSEQRVKVHGWVHKDIRKCCLWRRYHVDEVDCMEKGAWKTKPSLMAQIEQKA